MDFIEIRSTRNSIMLNLVKSMAKSRFLGAETFSNSTIYEIESHEITTEIDDR